MVQLDGEESSIMINNLRSTLDPDIHAGIKIMKTLLIRSVDDLKLAQEYEGIVDYFLFKLGEIDADLAAIKTYKGNTHFIIGNVEQEYLDQIKNFKHPMLLGVDIDNCTDVKVAVQTLAE